MPAFPAKQQEKAYCPNYTPGRALEQIKIDGKGGMTQQRVTIGHTLNNEKATYWREYAKELTTAVIWTDTRDPLQQTEPRIKSELKSGSRWNEPR